MAQRSDLASDRPDWVPDMLDFPVVGLGASAGGHGAFEGFPRNVGPGMRAAYILVQRLDPRHESMLPELLGRHRPLPVTPTRDGTGVRPGTVHIIASTHALTIEDGVLSLPEFEAPRGRRRPIDLFQAPAVDQGPNAAAIVLSGTGDGTVGIRHIKEACSLATLFAEAVERMRPRPEVRVFATDIDEELLPRAREAIYMQSDVADLPPELLQRHFTATDEGCLANPTGRDMVRVSAHSVIEDPPFSRIDLISCRNLLICPDADSSPACCRRSMTP